MIEHYISHEKLGLKRAISKAYYLRDVMGYKVLSIEHKQVPMAGSTSTPESPTWGKTELGYYITVDTDGYSGEKPPIPKIIEC